MKEAYETPDLEIVEIDEEDVIFSSSVIGCTEEKLCPSESTSCDCDGERE